MKQPALKALLDGWRQASYVSLKTRLFSNWPTVARVLGIGASEGTKMVDGLAYWLIDKQNRMSLYPCAYNLLEKADKACGGEDAANWVMAKTLHPFFNPNSQSAACRSATNEFAAVLSCRGASPIDSMMAMDHQPSVNNTLEKGGSEIQFQSGDTVTGSVAGVGG